MIKNGRESDQTGKLQKRQHHHQHRRNAEHDDRPHEQVEQAGNRLKRSCHAVAESDVFRRDNLICIELLIPSGRGSLGDGAAPADFAGPPEQGISAFPASELRSLRRRQPGSAIDRSERRSAAETAPGIFRRDGRRDRHTRSRADYRRRLRGRRNGAGWGFCPPSEHLRLALAESRSRPRVVKLRTTRAFEPRPIVACRGPARCGRPRAILRRLPSR